LTKLRGTKNENYNLDPEKKSFDGLDWIGWISSHFLKTENGTSGGKE
jgi:hypothetical protein